MKKLWLKLMKKYCSVAGCAPYKESFTFHCAGEDEMGQYDYGLLKQECPRCLDEIAVPVKRYK